MSASTMASSEAHSAAAHGPTAHANWWWDYASEQAPDHNEIYYFEFTLMAIAYFFAMHLVVHLLAKKFAPVYFDMTNVKQTEYRSYVTSIIHAIVCVILSTIAMLYICGDNKTVFNSDTCINTVRYVHIWALIHTCGYFIVDFFFIFCVIKGDTALDYQTYAHHIVAVCTFYQTLYFMDVMVVFGVMLLFMEISSIFVSMRWLLFTHGYAQSKWYAANAICMFFTFLLGRLIFQVYIVVWYLGDWVYAEYMKKNLTFYQGTVVTEMVIMVILSIVLNSYWMLLMIKMIVRVISRARTVQHDPIEKVELVKADALAIDAEADDCGSSTQGSNMGEGEIAEEGCNDPEIQD